MREHLNDLATSVLLLRRGKGWSRYRLSVESGVQQNCIADIEVGKRDPRLSTLIKLADALECTLSDLAGRN